MADPDWPSKRTRPHKKGKARGPTALNYEPQMAPHVTLNGPEKETRTRKVPSTSILPSLSFRAEGPVPKRPEMEREGEMRRKRKEKEGREREKTCGAMGEMVLFLAHLRSHGGGAI